MKHKYTKIHQTKIHSTYLFYLEAAHAFPLNALLDVASVTYVHVCVILKTNRFTGSLRFSRH